MPRSPQSYNPDENPPESSPMVPGTRLEPPAELRPAEAAVWRRIVARLPPDWIGTDDVMLRELCRHSVHADELAVQLEEIRTLRTEIKASPQPDVRKLELVLDLMKSEQALLRAHGYQSERIGNLATKLRLTNQSQEQPKKAGTARSKVPDGPKPWEDWGENARRREAN